MGDSSSAGQSTATHPRAGADSSQQSTSDSSTTDSKSSKDTTSSAAPQHKDSSSAGQPTASGHSRATEPKSSNKPSEHTTSTKHTAQHSSTSVERSASKKTGNKVQGDGEQKTVKTKGDASTSDVQPKSKARLPTTGGTTSKAAGGSEMNSERGFEQHLQTEFDVMEAQDKQVIDSEKVAVKEWGNRHTEWKNSLQATAKNNHARLGEANAAQDLDQGNYDSADCASLQTKQ